MASVPPLNLRSFADVVRTVSIISSNRARSVLEAQRIMALYSGNFYREILPALYDASIVDQARFLALMESKTVETMLTTRELLELAVAWGITPSATEFWKRYKSRDDLVACLQRKKAEQDMLARSEEHQPLVPAAMPTSVAKDARKPKRMSEHRRRSSVAMTLQSAVGTLFNGAHASQGDIFSTNGEYMDSIVYRARRLCADDASLAANKSRAAGLNAYAKVARNRVRNGGSLGDSEADYDEYWTGVDDDGSPLPDSPRRISTADGLTTSPQQGARAAPGPIPPLVLDSSTSDAGNGSRATAPDSGTDASRAHP